MMMQGVLAPIELAMMGSNLALVEMLMEKYKCQADQTVVKVSLNPNTILIVYMSWCSTFIYSHHN